MTLSEYDEQRLRGAEEIILKIRAFAREKGIAFLECHWDDGHEIISRNKHILEIRARGKSSKGIFSDKQLVDYSGGVGTERTDGALQEMVCNLV